MPRTIDELIKLNTYDDLTNDEVLDLIAYHVNIAYSQAYNSALKSTIAMDSYLLTEQNKLDADRGLQMIKDCIIDFKAKEVQ